MSSEAGYAWASLTNHTLTEQFVEWEVAAGGDMAQPVAAGTSEQELRHAEGNVRRPGGTSGRPGSKRKGKSKKKKKHH